MKCKRNSHQSLKQGKDSYHGHCVGDHSQCNKTRKELCTLIRKKNDKTGIINR